ncbi:CLUMA_CG017538, isoform A [Clunio marinus]|uniref:CLUMA_CG017538, isoform A n=1 Tax=Clunio marinus TaxID=568069 RepID=A0A1J1IZ57_9DIPT|nr:CLUMA_CG017538, isoform A [Clunio marinus]
MASEKSFCLFSMQNQEPYVVYQCKELFDDSKTSDVIFVSREKSQIKAHQLILSLSSPFFKELFSDFNSNYNIILPNYSAEVILAFVQFFYTGEIHISGSLLKEFTTLCHEFRCEEIPIISELIKSQKANDEIENQGRESSKWLRERENSLEVVRVTEVSTKAEVEMEFDEYFKSNDNVETIFFNENENNESEIIAKQGNKGIKEEYLNEEYIIEENQFDDTREKNLLNNELPDPDYSMKDPQQMSNSEVSGGSDYLNESKKEERTDGDNLRNVQQYNMKTGFKRNQINSPSITFPTVAVNLNQLREEQNRFKRRLQEAINSCRDSNNSVKKASKMFGVPASAIERNLRGYKNFNSS